ncbi:MAG: LacI family DNA-binding transcriptional regulator [Spirochaetota bacterium]
MRITIKDIARETGYSKTTVSFAFNDPAQISAEARRKILETADRLGYVPDPVARSLSRKRLGAIGLLLPQPIPFSLHNPYMVRLISGLGRICNDEGLSLTMLPPKRGSLVNSVRAAAVDGLVTIGLEPEHEVVTLIKNRHIPFVTIDAHSGPGVPSITVNDRSAAQIAMDYLLAAGHRRVSIVMLADGDPSDQQHYSGIGALRMRGYDDALHRHGLSCDAPAVVRIDQPCSIEGGRAAARVLLRSHPDVTGVVCMSDVIAIGIYEEFQGAGRVIPRDLSVVGFDDIHEAELLRPPLTTVHQPAEEKGARAGELLVRMIRKEEVDEQVEFSCSLIERASVARLATTDPSPSEARA